MTTGKQDKPDRVSGPPRRSQTRPDGEVRARWAWTEASVWTRRMLTALENGVKAGRWHSLIDKLYNRDTLRAAFKRVAANGGAPGVDHVTIEAFARHLDENLDRLHAALKAGSYRPQALRRVYVPKPGRRQKRPLGIPTVRDRVVQTALKQVLEPIFERDFAEHSYGFRPGRSCKDALGRVDALLKAGYSHIVDADLASYFETIPHERLMDRIRSKVSDTRVLSLIELFLGQGVMEGLAVYRPEAGTPQGAVMSPLLSNVYLDAVDHLMAAQGFAMVRYADDFVVMCRSDEAAQAALDLVTNWVEAAGLKLHPDKSGIATHEAGFDFLGYHFQGGRRWPRKKSQQMIKAKIGAQTKRTSGCSLDGIIAAVNEVLRGWYAYYKHSHPRTFMIIDGWVRMRLRSILRRRSGRTGPGRGFDHQRWPNAYFASRGLFSLKVAYVLERQSSLR